MDDIVVLPRGPIRADTDTNASIRQRPGGSASNVAAWLGASGAAVDFVGRVGRDERDRHVATFARYGVTARLDEDEELPTGAIVVIVEDEMRTMLTERGANARLTADAVGDALLDAASLVHLTGYTVFGSTDPAAVSRLIARAAERAVPVSVDPGSAGYLADFGVDRFLSIVDGATLFFPNLEEGRLLTGVDEPEAIVASLAERFPLVALTMDTAGVVLLADGDVARVDAVPARIVDPTGAGDAFAAGFLAHWVTHRDALAAARSGAEAGARAVATIGARPPA